MEKKDGTKAGNRPGKDLIRINRNLLIFSFFLFLSFIFWYLNTLSKELDTNVRYPVSYTNLPSGKTLKGELPPRLNLLLKGHGYSILRLKLSGNGHPVKIDFSEVGYKKNRNGGPGDYYILTTPLLNSFNAQLISECKILSVKPDTLFFSFN